MDSIAEPDETLMRSALPMCVKFTQTQKETICSVVRVRAQLTDDGTRSLDHLLEAFSLLQCSGPGGSLGGV